MPLFEDLFPASRGEALRNWLRADGASIFSQFDNVAETLAWARGEGLAIRTSDFYDIAREIKDRTANRDTLLAWAEEQLIPLADHSSEHGLSLSRNFLYTVNINGINNETGELQVFYQSFSSDRQMTPQQLFTLTESYVAGAPDVYGYTVENMSMEQALVSPSYLSPG